MDIAGYAVTMIQSGLGSLASYLAAHVLLCLVPAFIIAGAMTALIPKEAITRFLGRDAPKLISYPAAAVGGFVLAVCSCTIMPLFAGIYKRGAGLGPAITFLFVGPAINILALTYTGAAIGFDIAIARLVLSIVFGIGIGLIMAAIFWVGDRGRAQANEKAGGFGGQASIRPAVWAVMLLLFAVLLVGTLQVGLFTSSYAQVSLPVRGADAIEDGLARLIPFDPSRGEEGVSFQGLFLIGLLALVGAASWKGLSRVDERFNRWTWVALGLLTATLLVAALRVEVMPAGIALHFTGRFLGEVVVLGAVAAVAWKGLDEFEVQEWLWEMWRFVKQIFPLLIVGVFAAGVVRVIIRPEWVEAIAGSNTIAANFVGVVFGVFMYFPTLVEVPIAKMFLDLGMHRGPLLAYLMSDPELSIQSILITASIIGRKRAWVYVFWVALFSTLAGLGFGALVNGADPLLLGAYALLGLAALIGSLTLLHRRPARADRAAEAG
ncbi:MAG: permease [Anaerolineae bacterium]|nr:permease [Anaerolineae bacterium]